LPALTALFLHPGITFPATLKVTFPGTDATAVMFLAWRKTKLPSGIVSETLAVPLEIVIDVAVEIAAK
jgi:hypothetical protein